MLAALLRLVLGTLRGYRLPIFLGDVRRQRYRHQPLKEE